MVYCLVFYDIRDHKSIDGWDEKYPDRNKMGIIMRNIPIKPPKLELGLEMRNGSPKNNLLNPFLEMTGASFYEMKLSAIVLWDEVG